jgi:hypothetical protein
MGQKMKRFIRRQTGLKEQFFSSPSQALAWDKEKNS